MYKYCVFLGILISFGNAGLSHSKNDSVVSQNQLIGVWQVGSDVVSSTLQANFQFYKTGRYIYNFNGYAELNPIFSITGNYK